MKWINKKSFAVWYYTIFLLFIGLRWINGLSISQLANNPIHSPRIDPVVWLSQYSGIPDLIAHTGFSIVFDLIIIVLPLVILFRLWKDLPIHKLSLFHFVAFAIYVLIIYCYPTLSIRKYLGLVLIPLAFLFKKEERYYHFLELIRYFVCYVFVSASLWKLVRGVIWDDQHMYLTLKAQHIDNMVNWPDHFITKLNAVFLSDPKYCMILMILAVVSQLSFLIGFFTKKHDWLLFVFLILFILMDYLIMRIEYWEFIVFLPLFSGVLNNNKPTKSKKSAPIST